MKIHTKNYKSAISTFGRELDSKITILNSDLVLGKEDLYSVNIITNTDLLKSVMKEVDFESKLQIGEKQEVNIKSGIKVNGEYEYINYGNYIVYKSEYKAETNSYTHICYDKMLNTMIDYTPLDITYPVNLREYINAIATKCGLEFANIVGTFANYDTPINKDNFSNGNYTFRDVLDYVAELVGGWFCINDDDKLEIRYPELAKNYDKVSGENVSFISNVEDEINTIIVDGKSTQATSTQSANLCPPFTDSRWTFTNGAGVTSDGYLSIPATTGARAIITIPWNKNRTCYFKDIIVSGGNAHYSGVYFDESGTLLSSNGKAIVDKGANYQDETLWGGNNQYGDALTQTTNIKFTIQFSNFTPNPYVIKDLIISENDINYIPFTPNMPSPDYPSEIESLGTYFSFDEETGKYGIEVKNTGKNLFNCANSRIIYNNGNASYERLTNGLKIISSGAQYNILYFLVDTVENLKGKTLTLSSDISFSKDNQLTSFGLYYTDTNGGNRTTLVTNNVTSEGKYQVTGQVEEGENRYYVCIGLRPNMASNFASGDYTIYNNLQVEIGETATEYEPYKSVSSLFVLDQPLRSLPNGVKDELVIENGRAKIIKNVAKMIVENGNFYVGTIWNGYFVQPEGKINEANNRLLCDRAIANKTYTDGTMYANEVNVMFVGNNTDTIETLKAKYDGATLYYQLATPIEIDLGEVEIPSTFIGNNNITLSANINTNIDITYTKEYEEVDREFLKDVNVSFSKKYGPVNSVVFSRGGGSDNIYRKDYDSISANGLTEIKITDNPFLEDDERENFIQSVFDKLNGLEFYIMDVASTGITYLELGDLYYFNMSEDKPSLKAGLVQAGLRKAQGSSLGKYICLMLNDKIDITQGLSESIYADEPDITETDYKTASITDKSIKNAIIQTNKNSAEILLKVNSDEVVSAINLSPEKIKIQSSKIDVDGVLSVLGKAGSTVINGANITTGSISCDRLNGGTLNGQKIVGGSISITKGNYYFNMGTSTSNPNCSGLNVGNYGIKAYSDITATGFAITDSDIGKSGTFILRHSNGTSVVYLTFTGGILTAYDQLD